MKSASTVFNYLYFDNVLAFNSFTDSQLGKLSVSNNAVHEGMVDNTRNRILSGSDWYGTPVPTGIAELEEHKKYLGMHLTGQVQNEIKKHLSQYLNYLNSEIMPKRRLSYNDRGIGIFSFNRAGTGLYRMNKIDLKTPVDEVITKIGIALDKTRLQTHVKNVYAYFENKLSNYPSLRLYVLAGANANVGGNEILFVGLACGELVEFLEARGVPVEINVLLGTSFNGQASMAVVRVKKFEDRLDKNQLLLLASDPRFFRFRGFASLIALANYFELEIPRSLGRIVPQMGTDFVKALGANGFVFEQSYSLNAASNEIVRIINDYKENLKNGKRT